MASLLTCTFLKARYLQFTGFGATTAARKTVFLSEGLVYFNKTVPNYIPYKLPQMVPKSWLGVKMACKPL